MAILKPILPVLLSLCVSCFPIEEPNVIKRDVLVTNNPDIYDFSYDEYEMTEDDILEEIRLGRMELISQVVQAEAGNQGLYGMRLVADVILNRVDSKRFPDTVEDVIFQDYQFSSILDGNFDKAAWNMSDEAYQAVEMEWCRDCRLDSEILYFSIGHVNGKGGFQYGDHWFSY